MNCNGAKRMISLYTDGELKEKQTKELLCHIDSCPKCRKDFDFTSEIFKNLPAAETVDASPYFFQKLQRRIKENKDRKLFPIFNPRLAVASFITLSIIIVSSFFAGILIGDAYWTQTNNSEPASVQEAKSALKLEVLEDFPGGSVGDLYSKTLGGA